MDTQHQRLKRVKLFTAYLQTITVTHQTQWKSYSKIHWANINKNIVYNAAVKICCNFHVCYKYTVHYSQSWKKPLGKWELDEMKTGHECERSILLIWWGLQTSLAITHVTMLLTNICVWSEQNMLQLRLLLVNLLNCELLIYRLLWNNVPASNHLQCLPIYNLCSHVEQRMLECGT